ncbi:MAG: ATP synthase subunit I [Syntrophaceae bacterium]|nr:ATP synthase subunit I [Syntrophaceae bacterium]
MSNHLNAEIFFPLAAALAFGLVLGIFYFTVLWRTLQRLSSTASSTRLLLISFIGRMAVVLAGFYFIMGTGHWERLAAALVGFVIMKMVFTHRLGVNKAV